MKEEAHENTESKPRGIQDYLSLGYLYLLVLGIFKDAIFYGFLGVNIISYSNIQDILLSPLIHLTSNRKIFITFLVIIPLFSLGVGYLSKKYHAINRHKEWYNTKKNFEKWDKAYGEDNAYGFLYVLLLLSFFGGFIGSGLGGGQKIAKKLKSGTLEIDHQITFTDKEILEVNLIGHNSEYLFYAAENDTTVTIIPIQGNIKKIEKME